MSLLSVYTKGMSIKSGSVCYFRLGINLKNHRTSIKFEVARQTDRNFIVYLKRGRPNM